MWAVPNGEPCHPVTSWSPAQAVIPVNKSSRCFSRKKSQRLPVGLTCARICRWTKINCLHSFLEWCKLKGGCPDFSCLPLCTGGSVCGVAPTNGIHTELMPPAQGSFVTALASVCMHVVFNIKELICRTLENHTAPGRVHASVKICYIHKTKSSHSTG